MTLRALKLPFTVVHRLAHTASRIGSMQQMCMPNIHKQVLWLDSNPNWRSGSEGTRSSNPLQQRAFNLTSDMTDCLDLDVIAYFQRSNHEWASSSIVPTHVRITRFPSVSAAFARSLLETSTAKDLDDAWHWDWRQQGRSFGSY